MNLSNCLYIGELLTDRDMVSAYEIKTNKSDYPFLVVASKMTDAIELYCRLTENVESTIESIRVLPYVPYQVFIPTMDSL